MAISPQCIPGQAALPGAPARRFFRSLITLSIFSIAACNQPPAGLYQTIETPSIAYVQRGDRSLLMDIVQPRNAPVPRPAVLMFHGGGWIGGNRSHMADMAQFLAGLGYTAATAQYRLASRKGPHYPAQIQDAIAAVKFLKSRAKDFGVDPERIAVMGESAGGQIALLVGFATETSKHGADDYPNVSARVAAVVDIYGPTNLPDLVRTGDFVAKYVAPIYLDEPLGGNDEVWRDASPTSHVRADAPPVLIVHGNADSTVPISQAEQLFKAMCDIGAHCQIARVADAGHGWGSNFTGNTCMRTLPVIAQFLAEHLRPSSLKNQ